jgi:hypothetical protein
MFFKKKKFFISPTEKLDMIIFPNVSMRKKEDVNSS